MIILLLRNVTLKGENAKGRLEEIYNLDIVGKILLKNNKVQKNLQINACILGSFFLLFDNFSKVGDYLFLQFDCFRFQKHFTFAGH